MHNFPLHLTPIPIHRSYLPVKEFERSSTGGLGSTRSGVLGYVARVCVGWKVCRYNFRSLAVVGYLTDSRRGE
jgi:hypothetical protein